MKRREIKRQIKDNELVLAVDKNNIDEVHESLKNIIKVCSKKVIVKLDYDKKLKNEKITDITEVIHAINIKDLMKRYDYIYDTVCAKLDERIKTNYCEFKDDICVKYRKKGSVHKNGCCECKGRGKCKYLVDSVCTMKSCMACKLFTCHTLKKLGITQNINDFVLTRYFFTTKQKDILQFSYWTPKEIVMEKLSKTVK